MILREKISFLPPRASMKQLYASPGWGPTRSFAWNVWPGFPQPCLARVVGINRPLLRREKEIFSLTCLAGNSSTKFLPILKARIAKDSCKAWAIRRRGSAGLRQTFFSFIAGTARDPRRSALSSCLHPTRRRIRLWRRIRSH